MLCLHLETICLEGIVDICQNEALGWMLGEREIPPAFESCHQNMTFRVKPALISRRARKTRSITRDLACKLKAGRNPDPWPVSGKACEALPIAPGLSARNSQPGMGP